MKSSLIRMVVLLASVVIDFSVYTFLCVLLMGYDDNWDSTKGEYGTLASMNAQEKLIHFSFIAWNFINLIVFIYIGWWVYRRVRKAPSRPGLE